MGKATEARLAQDQPGMTPIKVIQTYFADDWEAFVEEWTEGFEPRYDQVTRIGGAGDLGRDVIGHIEPANVRPRPCDVYQCKHYDHPLAPTDVYTELGKLCVHTWREEYPLPRRYRFASPQGVGTKLYNLMNHPDQLKEQLVKNWEKYCKERISDAEEFPLEGDLKAYVEEFDFKIVWFLTPQELLNQHQRTKHWFRRFRIDPPRRPEVPPHPEQVQADEMKYVTELFNVYTDQMKSKVASINDLVAAPRLHNHFRRSRGHFFSAEALSRFSREQFAPGTFDCVKGHVLDGIEPLTLATYPDSFACVLEVTKEVVKVQLPASDLTPYVGPADRIGLCHHLVNENKLRWCDHARPADTK